METLQILNGQGARVVIEIERSDEIEVRLVSQENAYCIACGTMHDSADVPGALDIIHVGAHSLQNWLRERNHDAKEDDYVLLCSDCEEEAIC